MNLNFKLQGAKMIKKLSIRFFHNKLDISSAMTVMLMDSEWNQSGQCVINNPDLNISLQRLKLDILKSYNSDFCKGVVIDKLWLQKVIKTSFLRPKLENGLISPDYTIYVSDFATWWLNTHSSKWNVSHKKFMDKALCNQYKKFVKIFIEYQGVVGEKIQLRNVHIEDLKSFVDYLETENYQTSTIERHLGRFRFFLNRATEHNIEVNQSYKQRIIFDKDEDFEGVYLSEEEISIIAKKDFSYNEELNIAKDNFLIGLHTGMRISDFLKLDTSNISDGIIKVKTKKTNTKIVIPMHPVVQGIISSRFGNLPPKMNSSDFNKHIKTICQVCEIDGLVYGKLFDKDSKRKKIGYFKKYKLISSHVCRRSFATNNFDKVSREVLNAVCGWSKKSNQALHYNKKSKMEYAEIMKSKWNQ